MEVRTLTFSGRDLGHGRRRCVRAGCGPRRPRLVFPHGADAAGEGEGRPVPADRRPRPTGGLVFSRVREMLGVGGCPVCRLVADAVHRFPDAFLYERVNEPHVRDAVRAAWGFCTEHAWAPCAQRDPVLGLAIVYQDLVRALCRQVESTLHLTAGADLRRTAADKFRPRSTCPPCEHQGRTEEVYLSALLEHLDDPEVHAALSGPASLCLPPRGRR